MARRQPAGLRVGLLGKQGANQIERLDVRERIRPRRAADRRLVDEHDVFELPGAEHVVEFERVLADRRVVVLLLRQLRRQRRIERLLDERALPRAAHARHQAQHAERKLDREILQIVAARADELDPAVLGRPPLAAAEPPPPGKPIARATLARPASISAGVP